MIRFARFATLLSCLLVCACSHAPPPAEPPAGGEPIQRASSTASPRPAVSSAIRLDECSEPAGLTEPHRDAAAGRYRLIETMGSGLALIDYDGDGRLDLFVGQGGTIPPLTEDPRWWSRLYRNEGSMRFRDVTRETGIGFGRYAQGTAVGDVNGDGRDDLFVAGFGRNALYINRDGKRFEEVAERAGVAGSGWATSCGFADFDGDGDLDLFVVRYLAGTVDENGEPTVRCNASPGRLGYCPPNAFSSETCLLYRNRGDGTFEDVSISSGLASARCNGLGLAIADLDGDGLLDAFVASDQSPNLLFLNRGEMRFEERALASGVALSENGQTRAGMGVAVGDADGDGAIDLCVTNFFEEGVTLYRNLGAGRFQVTTAASRLLPPTRSKLGFGAGFVDFDGDGSLDLFIANGHINDVSTIGMPYEMESQVFRNVGGGRFADVSTSAGDFFRVKQLGRAAAFGDLDDDGRIDVVMSRLRHPPALLHNRTEGGRSIVLELIGANPSRTAVGSRIRAEISGRAITRWVVGASSYLSTSDRRVDIGLGDASRIDRLEIDWLSGRKTILESVEAGRVIRVEEPRGVEASPRDSMPR